MFPNSIEEEFNVINAKDGWHSLFQEIREKCDREAKERAFSMSESGKDHNRSLNRYRDVNPYDHSRIVIRRGKVDYINANLVKMERADRKYILTQGPLRETIGHFWLMVWEQNTKAILMLNKLLEKKQVKCHMYWPEKTGEQNSLNLSDVGLTVEYLKCEEYVNFSKRIFRLTDHESKTSREIIQFHYTTWPDFGIPSSPVAFLHFLRKVRESGALDSDVGPAVVHCSAGIGRSGTFCLVDCCLVLIDKEEETNVSVQDILYELRRYRMGLIQTADQLYFSYQAIIQGIKLLKDSSFNDYEEVPVTPKEENIDEVPPPLPPRTHSLHVNASTTMNKPLPMIPNSESLHEDFITNLNESNALINFIKGEKGIDCENNSINRPLPPVPKQNSLEKVSESESENDEDDSSEDEHTAEFGNDKSQQTGSKFDKNTENFNNAMNDIESSSGGIDQIQKPMHNGLENVLPSTNEGSETLEVRRRKRRERLAVTENKVKEIKRKTREIEEEIKSSKKRRSLLYITAGVIVGVLCVYAYSKFG